MRKIVIFVLLLSGCAARKPVVQQTTHVETFTQVVPAAGTIVFRFRKPFINAHCVSNEKAQGLEWDTKHVRAHLAEVGSEVTITCRETTK
jgi:hypothetical protein